MYVLQAASFGTSLSFPHVLAGDPAEFGLDPRKAFGDDLGESHRFTSAAIFDESTKDAKVR